MDIWFKVDLSKQEFDRIGQRSRDSSSGWWKQRKDFVARDPKNLRSKLLMFSTEESMGCCGNFCNEQSKYLPGQKLLDQFSHANKNRNLNLNVDVKVWF